MSNGSPDIVCISVLNEDVPEFERLVSLYLSGLPKMGIIDVYDLPAPGMGVRRKGNAIIDVTYSRVHTAIIDFVNQHGFDYEEVPIHR